MLFKSYSFHFQFKILSVEMVGCVQQFVEIIRRFIWNFIRVELEHLHNCAELKAVPDYTSFEREDSAIDSAQSTHDGIDNSAFDPDDDSYETVTSIISIAI